jgi:hypothetical protein
MAKYKNDYPEDEDDISLEELLERERYDSDDEEDFLEPDDMEELDFEREYDSREGWYEGLGPCSRYEDDEDEG